MGKGKLTTLALLVALIVISSHSQGCLNHLGNPVDWWVVLKVPPKIGNSGFGYYDSTFKSGTFQYVPNHVDEGATGLTMTILQINILNM